MAIQEKKFILPFRYLNPSNNLIAKLDHGIHEIR